MGGGHRSACPPHLCDDSRLDVAQRLLNQDESTVGEAFGKSQQTRSGPASGEAHVGLAAPKAFVAGARDCVAGGARSSTTDLDRCGFGWGGGGEWWWLDCFGLWW